MNIRLAKFKDLIPSTLPFVEGKLDGHKERKNYSILGPALVLNNFFSLYVHLAYLQQMVKY